VDFRPVFICPELVSPPTAQRIRAYSAGAQKVGNINIVWHKLNILGDVIHYEFVPHITYTGRNGETIKEVVQLFKHDHLLKQGCQIDMVPDLAFGSWNGGYLVEVSAAMLDRARSSLRPADKAYFARKNVPSDYANRFLELRERNRLRSERALQRKEWQEAEQERRKVREARAARHLASQSLRLAAEARLRRTVAPARHPGDVGLSGNGDSWQWQAEPSEDAPINDIGDLLDLSID
jgi:hypothetical protein